MMIPLFILSTFILSSQGFSPTTPSYSHATAQCSKKNPYSRCFSSKGVDDSKDDDNNKAGVEEYKNVATKILSNFMQSGDDTMNDTEENDPLSDIDFNSPKIDKVDDLQLLASMLDYELYNSEWFVTGNVNPAYFSDEFEFQDPDVKLKGIEEYARGVNKLFDQETSRAEIISTVVNPDTSNSITVTWRLSGRVNIGPLGLPIKPYICYTDFDVSEDTGLITFQEDRFDIPQWDILLSALFPALIGKITSDPAPEVAPRTVVKPGLVSASSGDDANPFTVIFSKIFK